MWQAKVVICLKQRQLLVQARFLFAQRGDAPSNRSDMLTDAAVAALNECRVDLPAVRGEHLLDGLQGPEHDAVAYADQAPPAHGLDDLRIAQLRQWHPARLRCRAGGPAAWWLDPL